MLRRPSQARLGHARASQAGRAGTVQLGRGGFSAVAFDLFLYFLNIFKSLKIQKFVQDSFELGKL
jgi:hypothetical protein